MSVRRLIEAYGTGIRKIMGAYGEEDIKPLIENTTNAFKIALPNINVSHLAAKRQIRAGNEERVIELVKQNGFVVRADVEEKLGINASSASRLIKRMIEQNELVQQGKAKRVRYMLPGKDLQ